MEAFTGMKSKHGEIVIGANAVRLVLNYVSGRKHPRNFVAFASALAL
jgi:hypothetical protein